MINHFSKKAISRFCKTAMLIFFSAISTSAFCQGFYVSGSNVKDANGNNFVIRGINNPHIWFDAEAYNALTNLAAKKTNTIRIVWTTSGSASRLDQIIQRCIDLQMVPMVELHDATGSNDPNRLNAMANYYVRSDVKAVMQKHARYIMINIANEWSDGSKTEYDWKEQYKTAISIIRNAGITTMIVIDAPGYAQNSNGPLWYGQELLNYDPRHNLLFSIHMYVAWNDPQKIRTELGNLKYNNLPIVIGEFGYNYNNGNNNLGCRVDHTVVMQECQSKGYGYIPWSYKGNDAANAWLDLSSNWNSLLYWGNEVFYNTNGINNTSYKASVFTGGGSTGPISDGTYKISFRHSNLSLNVEGNSTADGGNVVQWTYNNGTNEQWYVKNLGGGQYSIRNVNSGKGLDVVNNSTADGADINQWYYSGGNNQKWRIESLGSNFYRIVNVNSSKCIDMPGASTTAGASISQYGCNGANNQSFYFTKTGDYAGREAAVTVDKIEASVNSELIIYPNPSSGAFTVNSIESYNYTIYNTAGAVVEKGRHLGKASVGAKLSPGIYILKTSSEKEIKKFKLVKN